MRALIVDDSKIVCDGLQQMITNVDGVKIIGQANNGPDAIKSISKLKPDVVILTYACPA